MAKQSGMGDRAFVGGYDLSGAISALDNIRGGPALLEAPDITLSAMARIGGIRDGEISFSSWFDDDGAANRAAGAGSPFVVLSALPTTDVQVMYFRGTTLGNPAAAHVAKQMDLPISRPTDGSLALNCQTLSNGFGLEWGHSLTAGIRTDSAATNGTSVDDLGGSPVSTAFGWSAYLQVFAFTGTSATVTLQDSADNVAFAALTAGAFTAATGITTERLQASSATATVRRYVRAVTTGTFSDVQFAVVFVRHLTATL